MSSGSDRAGYGCALKADALEGSGGDPAPELPHDISLTTPTCLDGSPGQPCFHQLDLARLGQTATPVYLATQRFRD